MWNKYFTEHGIFLSIYVFSMSVANKFFGDMTYLEICAIRN